METARDTAISSDASIPEDAPAPAERRVLQPVLFLEYVHRFAEAAKAAIHSLRLTRRNQVPRLEELIAPDVLQEGFSIDSFRKVLHEYFSAVPLAEQLPNYSPRRKKSADPIARNASEWDGDVVQWQQMVYPAERQHIDGLVEQLEKEAQAWQKPVEECSVRIHRLVRDMHGSTAQEPLGLQFNGLLAGAFKAFQKKLYAEAGLRLQDDLELLYRLSFQECVIAKGWGKLEGEELIKALEQEQVPIELFGQWTGKEVTLPKKKPETVKEVVEKVKQEAKRLSRRGGSSFSIAALDDRIQMYDIPVPYDGGAPHNISWGKELLNGSADLTQDEHVRRTLDTELKLVSSLVYGATLLALYNARKTVQDEEKKLFAQLTQLFQKDFATSHHYFFTSTRLIYTRQGPDHVFHNYGYADAQQRDLDLTGPCRYFTKEDADVLEALFGTRDVNKFTKAIKWLTGKKPHLWRCTAKPQQDDVRVFALGCCDYDFDFVADVDFSSSNSRPARGAVVTPS